MSIRVLYADCHPLFRLGIWAMLFYQADIRVVGEACDGNETQVMCLDLQPDVLLLEVCMPGSPVEETIRAVKSSCKDTKIIILTACDDEGYIRILLETGICGYILKIDAVESILEAIRAVMQGGMWLSPLIKPKMAELRDSTDPLTPREFEVLQLVGEGKTNREIGEALSITKRTARKHVESITQKMQVCNRTEAVIKAIRMGWIRIREN